MCAGGRSGHAPKTATPARNWPPAGLFGAAPAPAETVRAGPGRGEAVELGWGRVRARAGPRRGVVVGEGHRGLVTGEAPGIHVEHADSPRVGGVGVGDRGPRRVLGLDLGLGDVDALLRFARGVRLVDVVVALGAAGADHQVNEAQVGVHLVQLGAHHVRPQDGAGVGALHHVAALVVVVVAGEHEVDAVLVEQRHPVLADAQVRALRIRRGHGRLGHYDYYPVDRSVGRRLAHRFIHPLSLRAAGVAGQDLVVPGAPVAAGVDLVADVVLVQHDEQHRADLELV